MIISVPFVEEKVVCTPIIMKLVNSNEPGSFFNCALSGNYCHEGIRGRGMSEKKLSPLFLYFAENNIVAESLQVSSK